MLKRLPAFLRVVIAGSEVDALDQPDDTPKAEETCHAYILCGYRGTCHINMGRGRGGFYPMADYRLCPKQPPQEIMRDYTMWGMWCQANRQLAPEVHIPS